MTFLTAAAAVAFSDKTYLSIELRTSLDDSVVNDPGLHGIDEVDNRQRRLVSLVLEMLDL